MAIEGVEVLSVAGPRHSEDQEIYLALRAVLDTAFRDALSKRDT